MSHGYAEEGEHAQMKKTQMYSEVNKKEKLPVSKQTKASTISKEAIKKKQEEKKTSDFKLTKFKKIAPKTLTNNGKVLDKKQ